MLKIKGLKQYSIANTNQGCWCPKSSTGKTDLRANALLEIKMITS